MNNLRKEFIRRAFQKLDRIGDGVVIVQDFYGVYNVKKYFKYISGEWTEDQCFKQFLDFFDFFNDKDGKVKFFLLMYLNDIVVVFEQRKYGFW